jgi:hypothetical protein
LHALPYLALAAHYYATLLKNRTKKWFQHVDALQLLYGIMAMLLSALKKKT